MSYSFHVRAANKAAALAAVVAELDKVEAQQPIHVEDRRQAEAAAEAFISLVDEPAEGQQLAVSVSGSLGRWDGRMTNAAVSVSVGMAAIEG